MQLQIGNFILTITRFLEHSIANKKSLNKNIRIKRKVVNPDKALSIYRFNSFDDFCEFCTYITNILTNDSINKFKNAVLYMYNSYYYLAIKNVKLSAIDLNTFYSAITEFATYEQNNNLLECKLKEYGKIVLRKNAIETTLKYFS